MQRSTLRSSEHNLHLATLATPTDQYISEAGIPEPMSSKRSDRNKNSRSERRGWRYFSDKTAADSEEDEDNDDDVFEDIKHEVDENKASVLDMQKLFGDGEFFG